MTPRHAGAALLAVALALFAIRPAFVESIAESLFDAYQRAMPRERETSPAVIVAIDEGSLDALGQWPWPRSLVAELVRRITAAGPAAVGLDILFPEPGRAADGGDEALATALASGATVLGIAGQDADDRPARAGGEAARAGGEPARALGVPPLRSTFDPASRLTRYTTALASIEPLDRAATGRGLLGADGSAAGVRRVPMMATVGGVPTPSLAAEMLRIATGTPLYRLSERRGGMTLSIGEVDIPLESDGALRVWYGASDSGNLSRRRKGTVFAASEVLEGEVPAESLRGKLVLVGIYGTGLQDVKSSPLGEQIPGVEIHAQVIEQIFDGRFIARPDFARWIEGALLLLAGIVVVAFVPSRRPAASSAIFLGLLAGLAAIGFSAFGAGVVLDVATPASALLVVFGGVLSATLGEAQRQRQALREAHARMEGELDAAKRIQLGLLPDAAALAAREPRIGLAARIEPARTVGGDFYDFFMIDSNRIFLSVADVSGKGLPASLFMALSKSLLKSIALRGGDEPGAILMRANAEIGRDNPEALFVTALAAILDLRSGELAFCNAGHEPPLLRTSGDAVKALEHPGGPPLCVIDGFDYPSATHRLAPGDWIVLVSDGVTEALDGKEALYGRARLAAVLGGLPRTAAPDAVVDALRDDVRRFVGAAEPSDDISIVCLRWNGPGETSKPDDDGLLADLDGQGRR